MDPEPISIILSMSSQILAVLILLVLSALISSTEVAFFSLSKTDLDKFLETKTSNEKAVISLLEKPRKLLATILIANNFVNILIVLLFAALGTVIFNGIDAQIRFFLEVILVTFLILLFGEVLPKVYATRNAAKVATFMAKPIQVLSKIVSPISMFLISLTLVVERRLGKKNTNFSVEKLSKALELTSNDTTVKNQKNILEGIVTFGNTETVQVMKPRIDIFAISDSEEFKVILEKIITNGFSRNPVYHESIDEIIGVIYTKDLLPHMTKEEFNWQTLIRAPYFVPENKKLDDLLIDFQEKKNHLAIVVDEYGGTSGLITLEDVIEEIVGDISDEFDIEDLSYSKIDASNFVFEGKTNLKDFCRILNVNPEKFEQHKGESETLAGFILEISRKFPKKSEKINFENYVFTIEVVDRKRIKQVKVTILPNAIS